MLTGRLPYGGQGARVRTRSDARKLHYVSACHEARPLPEWMDGALRTAVHPDPLRRHEALSEFVADLRTPNPRFVRSGLVPLAERNPVRFWQGVCVALLCVVVLLALKLAA